MRPMASSGRAAQFAAQRHRLVVLLGLLDDQPHGAQRRRAQRIIAARELRIAAVGGEEELHQIIGADRGEIDDAAADGRAARAATGSRSSRRASAAGAACGRASADGLLDLDHLDRALVFLDIGDHREHDLHAARHRPPASGRAAAGAAGPGGPAPCGSSASRAPGSLPWAGADRAASCRRRCRACGR